MIIYYTDRFKGGRTESHRLLEEALSEYTGDAARAKILVEGIKTGAKGKPYIEGFGHFSISHTGSIWAVLIADCECGMDIQLERNCNVSAIAKRIFAPEDTKAVSMLFTDPEEETSDFGGKSNENQAAESQGQKEFFRLWTRREALVKAMGGSVYDTGLPSVLQDELVIDGKNYFLMDVAFPVSLSTPDLPDLHSAVCLTDKFPASLEFEIMDSNNKGEKNRKTASEAAYTFLDTRMRTTEEVRKHLKSRGYPEDEITETVNDLIGMRYLDDYLFALRYYEHNREKKRGVLRAERELAEKGIDRETIRNAKEDFLYEQEVDEFEDALEIARKEVYVPSGVYGGPSEAREVDDKLTAKIARKLEGKGFSKGDIFRVIDTIRRESSEDSYYE